MEDSQYNSQIEKIATLLTDEKISPDEQDEQKLQKFFDFAKNEFNLSEENAKTIVYEALLYLKLHSSDSADPLQEGDKFGVGFS